MNCLEEKILFVPACLLCPSLMAKKSTLSIEWRSIVLQQLIKSNFSIIQMPCPEASFPSFAEGLQRSPHGVDYYENLPGFVNHCANLGLQVVSQIDALMRNGYNVCGIVGIEHSPTCAATFMYTHLGTQKRQGIFINHLTNSLAELGYSIPIIGINRRFPQKAVNRLIIIDEELSKENRYLE